MFHFEILELCVHLPLAGKSFPHRGNGWGRAYAPKDFGCFSLYALVRAAPTRSNDLPAKDQQGGGERCRRLCARQKTSTPS
jgi:hypothetical protein